MAVLCSSVRHGTRSDQLHLFSTIYLNISMVHRAIQSATQWYGIKHPISTDLRIFSPCAQSNRHSRPTSCYRKHELIKKRQYEQRVREVEHASFTPLVLSATGGMAKEATVFYKRLAHRLSSKWDQPYNKTLFWLRSRITFSLLRSAIQCIRGARSSVRHAARPPPPMDLVSSELRSID